MDNSPEEIERKISIHSSVAFCEHKGAKVNIEKWQGVRGDYTPTPKRYPHIDDLIQAAEDGGYKLTDVTPVDQFLFSEHIEVVAMLER